MVRFRASEEEVALLLRFLTRRAPGKQLFFVPLAPPATSGRVDRRLRRTFVPLLRQLSEQEGTMRWALLTDETAPLPKTADECTLILDFGAKERGAERDILLEARDELLRPEPSENKENAGNESIREPAVALLSARSVIARDLVERAARRVRRRGSCEKGRWYIP